MVRDRMLPRRVTPASVYRDPVRPPRLLAGPVERWHPSTAGVCQDRGGRRQPPPDPMAGPFESIVARLEAARRLAQDLVGEGDVRFAAVVDNLDRLLALPRNDAFPAAAARQFWIGLPLHVDRGGGWTEPLTPTMAALIAALEAVRPAALAASPALQAAERRAQHPVATVVRCHGHEVTVLRSGQVIVDHAWLMPQTGSQPARLFPDAPAPYLIGQTALSLWIVDLDQGRWARLDTAPGTAGPHAFLDRLAIDRGRLAYDLPVLLSGAAGCELRRREVRLDDIEWGPCWQPDPELLARCAPEPEPESEPQPEPEELYQFLASYFGDQSTEEGVSEVVFVTAEHPAWHRRYLAVLDRGIAAAAAGDPEVARIIVKSFAASARDAGEARAYLEAVRAEYLRQYEEAIRAATRG